MEEDKNSIIFDCFGAIDFSEQINIELSLEEKEGFEQIHPLDLLWKIHDIKHIQWILCDYFYKIIGKYPHISDKNDNILIEKRFTKVYYKCYKKFLHSHDWSLKYSYTNMSLDEAIQYIKKENFSIKTPYTKWIQTN